MSPEIPVQRPPQPVATRYELARQLAARRQKGKEQVPAYTLTCIHHARHDSQRASERVFRRGRPHQSSSKVGSVAALAGSQARRLTDFSLQGVGELQAEVGVLQVMVATGIGTYIVL
jgi:hypothetical protein